MKKIFLTSSVNTVANRIAKDLGSGKGLKLAFIDTASEIEKGDLEWLKADRDALIAAGFLVTDYTITGKSKDDIASQLEKFDAIFFSGGNTFYLLDQIQKSDCTEVIAELVEDGKIYIGSSAGSIIAGPSIYPAYAKEEADQVPELENYEGLGLTDIVVEPHWGSDIFRDWYLDETMRYAYSTAYKILLLTDNQYLKIVDDDYKIIDITKDL